MKNLIYIIATVLVSSEAFSHGESNPGPNGGFIRMPGAFHTEIITDTKDGSFQLFLLDINFKNPTTKNSSVDAEITQKRNKKVKFGCEVLAETHFLCKPDKSYVPNSGKLTLKVKRDGAEGKAVYELPLQWAKPSKNEKEVDHSSHH